MIRIPTPFTRAIHAALLVMLVTGVAACEDALGIGEHNNVAELTLTVGGRSVVLTEGDAGTLQLQSGTHAVTITLRDSDGRAVSLAGGSDVTISSSSQSVARYIALSATTGTLVTAAGTAQLTVSVMHGTHADFEQTVTVTVQ